MSINEIWNKIESQICCALSFIVTKIVRGKNKACNRGHLQIYLEAGPELGQKPNISDTTLIDTT